MAYYNNTHVKRPQEADDMAKANEFVPYSLDRG